MALNKRLNAFWLLPDTWENLISSYVHPNSQTRFIEVGHGLDIGPQYEELRKLIDVRNSEWWKIVLLLLSVTTFKTSFQSTQLLSSLDADIIRMVAELLPLK